MKISITDEDIYNTPIDGIIKNIIASLPEYEFLSRTRITNYTTELEFKKYESYRLWLDKSGHVNVLNNPTDRAYADSQIPNDIRFDRWMSEWVFYTI